MPADLATSSSGGISEIWIRYIPNEYCDCLYSNVHQASLVSRKVATSADVLAVTVTDIQRNVTTQDAVWWVRLPFP